MQYTFQSKARMYVYSSCIGVYESNEYRVILILFRSTAVDCLYKVFGCMFAYTRGIFTACAIYIP